MKLITQTIYNVEVFTEAGDDGKESLFIEGVYLQAEQKNRNGRIYPLNILEKEVRRYNKEYIKESRAFGELGHPDGPTINLERVSHLITKLRKDGNNYVGKAKVLNSTPYGKIVEGLLKDGAKLGVSSRGMGSLEERSDGIKMVKDDFHLSTAADIVADPSAPNAFVQGIMEGREWIWDNGLLKESDIEDIKETIENKYTTKEREAIVLKAFDDFVSKF